jgi:hypothetical protein
MLRVLFATTNIFVSMVIGAIAMGLVWFFYPDLLESFFRSAAGLKAYIVNLGIPAKYNNFLMFLIEERQIVFIGFVVATRFVLALLTSIFISPFLETT